MKILFVLWGFIFMNCNISAQQPENVFFKKEATKIIFHRFLPRIIPKHYTYICFNRDSTVVYINTIMGLDRELEVIHDKYEVRGDSIFFKKNIDPGKFRNGKLYIPFWAYGIKKAKSKDINKFKEEYKSDLSSWNICFEDIYAIKCE